MIINKLHLKKFDPSRCLIDPDLKMDLRWLYKFIGYAIIVSWMFKNMLIAFVHYCNVFKNIHIVEELTPKTLLFQIYHFKNLVSSLKCVLSVNL
jgi:hypothetical protein